MSRLDRVGELTPGGLATMACLMEVAAPKPGNVHRGADFEGTTFYDFQYSAVVLGQTIDHGAQKSLGKLILSSVQANQRWIGQNTNLGIILLLCPLAMTLSRGQLCRESVVGLLETLTAEDSRAVYRAIELASPGGLGKSDQMDVADAAPLDLLQAMKLAEDRDLVARQYARGFQTVFDEVVPRLRSSLASRDLHESIVVTHVQLMAQFPDSLIARKCGDEVAAASQTRAQLAIDQLQDESSFWKQVGELDFWLRADGNRRNPGTTADLIAAGLFVLLAQGELMADLETQPQTENER